MKCLNVVVLVAALVGTSCGSPKQAGVPGLDYPYGTLPPGATFTGERNFAYLINHHREGRPERTPWVGFWWPYQSNGIASGTYGSGSSPAGKYDAARGGRTSAQSWEVQKHGSQVPNLQSWWGHCNGWCAASAIYEEPRETKTVNGISFSVADIKGLLTEVGMEVSADFYGNRVDWGQDYESPKFDDVIPNQYFLVLTNYTGKLKQTVLIDRYTGDQIWNQPVTGYRFEYPKPADYLGADPSAPGVYRLNLTGTLWWGRDDVDANTVTEPFNFETGAHFESRELRMELWLDGPVVFGPDGKVASSGNLVVTRKGDYLVGGAWKNGSGYLTDAHPDYMWVPYSVLKPNSTDPYANVHIEHEWLEKHVIPGVDDTTVDPIPIPTAPVPSRTPRPGPSVTPTTTPRPTPTFTPTPEPTPTETTTPRPPRR